MTIFGTHQIDIASRLARANYRQELARDTALYAGLNAGVPLLLVALNAMSIETIDSIISVVTFAAMVSVLLANIILWPQRWSISLYIFFLALFFMIPAAFPAGVVYWTGAGELQRSTTPLIGALVWIAALASGYSIARLSNAPRPGIPARSIGGRLAHDTRPSTVLLLIALTGALTAYLIYNPTPFFADRFHFEWAYNARQGARALDLLAFVHFPRALSFAGLLLATLVLRQKSTRAAAPVALWAAVIWLLYHNPLATPRQILLTEGVFLFLMWGFHVRWGKILWAILTLALFIIGPTISFFSREYYANRQIRILSHPDFDVFQNTQIAYAYVDDVGYTWGASLLRSFSFFLPSEKKISAPDLYTAAAAHGGYFFNNISMPVFNEFNADFGISGVVVISFVMGAGLWFCEKAAIHQEAGLRAQLFGTYMIAASLAIARGPLIGNLPYVALGSLAALAVLPFATRLKGDPIAHANT